MEDSVIHLLHQEDTSVRRYISIAALVLTVWDAVINADQEIQHIWHGEITWIKRVYLFARYFGILALLINLIMVLYLIDQSPTLDMCRRWYVFQLVATRLAISTIEIILCLRVYALYNMNRWIGALLLSTNVGGFLLTLICGTRTIFGLKFDPTCNALSSSYFDVLAFALGGVLRGGMVWFLTARHQSAAKREGWGESRILQLISRDSMTVSIGLVVMCMAVIPYMFLVKVAAHAIFLFPLALSSVYSCHLIMTTLDLRTRAQPSNTPPMSTLSFRGVSVY